MQKVRHSMVPAIYVIMRNGVGKVLATLRKNTGYRDGFWTMPSGHVEKGELPINAAIRETKEEVGLDVSIDSKNFVHLMTRLTEDATGERIDIFFETTNWKGEVVNSEPGKCERVEWVGIDDPKINWIPYVKHALQLIEKGIKYSEWRKYD